MARVFGCRESQISLTEEEAISGDIVYHPYDIFIESKSAKGLTFPKLIGGNLYLGRLASVENLKLPNYIGGYLDLSGITNAKGLNLPKYIGRLGLFKLVSIKDLNLEDVKIKEDIYFNNISKEQRKQLKSKYPHLTDKIV